MCFKAFCGSIEPAAKYFPTKGSGNRKAFFTKMERLERSGSGAMVVKNALKLLGLARERLKVKNKKSVLECIGSRTLSNLSLAHLGKA